jgi:cytochrome P450
VLTIQSSQTVVGVNSWVAHANDEVFGPDAETFRPERWLESKEKASNMERSFMAVSAFALGVMWTSTRNFY